MNGTGITCVYLPEVTHCKWNFKINACVVIQRAWKKVMKKRIRSAEIIQWCCTQYVDQTTGVNAECSKNSRTRYVVIRGFAKVLHSALTHKLTCKTR
jgi:hypothetical protein